MDVGAEIDFARALGVVDIGDRDEVRAAGAAVFIRRRDDRPVYDRVFDRYWRRRSLQPDLEAHGSEQRPEGVPSDEGTPQDAAMPGDERSDLPEDRQGVPIPTDGDPDDDSTAPDVVTISPDAYSKSETMRHRDFDRMTAQELRDAERLVDLLEPKLELRRTRRYELHRHGRRLAPRAMFRPTSAMAARSCRGSGGARSSAHDRWSCCATSQVRWSATPGCSCGSSRHCPRRRP